MKIGVRSVSIKKKGKDRTMGKTLRFDAKFQNEFMKYGKLEKCDNSDKCCDRSNFEGKGKNTKISKKSKRFLKSNFLQRIWPFTNESKKGRHKI